MLNGQSKTHILAEFPLKTWAKHFPLVLGAQGPITSAKKAETYPTYDITHEKPKT